MPELRIRNRLRLCGDFPRAGASPAVRTKTMIKLRKFSPVDLAKVLTIAQSAFTQPWPKVYFEKIYQKYPDGFIVAEEKEIKGFIIGTVSQGQGQLKLIAVDSDCRSRGIGKMLIESLLEFFKKKRVESVFVHTRTENKAGISFLKDFGFEITETIEKYYPNGENAYLMKKGVGG